MLDDEARELFEAIDVEDELLNTASNLLRLITRLAARNREVLLDRAFAATGEEGPR